MIGMGVGVMMPPVVTVVVCMPVTMMVMPMAMPMVVRPCADAFDVVVMAFLCEAHLVFKAKNLFAVFAELAIHQILSAYNLCDPFGKGI